MAYDAIEWIRDNDPEYDPIAIACQAAGIPRETAKAAADRVYCDGYYGPISADDWREQDGREPATVSDALEILKRLADAIPDYKVEDLHMCGFSDDDPCENPETCGGHPYEVGSVDAAEIADAAWPFVREIYGRRITNL